jgi:hypothetical protein
LDLRKNIDQPAGGGLPIEDMQKAAHWVPQESQEEQEEQALFTRERKRKREKKEKEKERKRETSREKLLSPDYEESREKLTVNNKSESELG